MFDLISSFLSNRQFQVVLDGKSSQEYSVNAGVPQGSILGPTLFLLYSNDLPDDVIWDFATCADNTTHYCKQQLEFVAATRIGSKIESDLRDTGFVWLVK